MTCVLLACAALPAQDGGALVGRVVDERGDPCVAKVRLCEEPVNPADPRPRHRLELQTDERGYFRAEVRPQTFYRGHAEGAEPRGDHRLVSASRSLLVPGTNPVFVTCPTAPAQAYSRVAAGWEREDLHLFALLDGLPGNEIELERPTATGTAHQGCFGPPGTFALELRTGDGALFANRWTHTPYRMLIDVLPPEEVLIEVVDAAGRPIPDALVEELAGNPVTRAVALQRGQIVRRWRPLGRTGGDGALMTRLPWDGKLLPAEFRFGPAGDLLTVKRPELQPGTDWWSGSPNRIRLTWTPSPPVTGCVLRDGVPVPHLRIEVGPASGVAEHATTTTGADGTFLIDALSATVRDLSLHLPDDERDGQPRRRRVLPLLKHGRRDFGTIELNKFRDATVQVLDERGGPAVGVLVIVHPLHPHYTEASASLQRLPTDAAGRVHLSLAPGNWVVFAGDDRRLGAAAVREGRTTTIALTQLTTLRCTVVGQDGHPVAGQRVGLLIQPRRGAATADAELRGDFNAEEASIVRTCLADFLGNGWPEGVRTDAQGVADLPIPEWLVGRVRVSVASGQGHAGMVEDLDRDTMATGLTLTLQPAR